MRKTKLFNGLIMAVILLMAASLSAGTYSGGSGTEVAPYEIDNTADLIELSTTSDDWVWDTYFIQTADIVFDETEGNVDWDGDGSADGSALDIIRDIPEQYVIIISAEQTVADKLNNRAIPFIHKPVTKQKLEKAISDLNNHIITQRRKQ